MNPWLSADNATADWRAAKLEWIVKDAEAKIAAEKLRIAAAKMQFRGTSVRSSQSCKVATFKNQTSFSTRFVKFAKLESLQCGQRSPSYWRRLERRKKERENTRERAEKHEDRLSKVDVNSTVVRFASRWCSEFNVMKRREEKKEKLRTVRHEADTIVEKEAKTPVEEEAKTPVEEEVKTPACKTMAEIRADRLQSLQAAIGRGSYYSGL